MSRLIRVILFVLLAGLTIAGQAKPSTTVLSATDGTNTVKIHFTTRPFSAKQHRVKQVSDEKKGVYGTWIDGKYALGTDLSVPRDEIISVRLYFNGKAVPVPSELYSDSYEPNFDKDSFWMKLSDDKKSVMALMQGGDAAGSYKVFWIFRSDGRHSRFSSRASDVSMSDFANWFFDK
jgi:hypothetical protein